LAEISSQGQRGRDGKQPLRLPNAEAERRRRPDPSAGNACDPDDRNEIELWLTAPAKEALALQWPLPDDALRIVARW
jgi:hypothetical protein